MNLDRVTPGEHCPDEVNVIIEIPAQSGPVKYEVDKDTGAMIVDRFMATAMFYPCNYGYVPRSLSDDGDPVDVLVVTPFPLISGSVIRCRPVGTLQMADEKGNDTKILAVPGHNLNSDYSHVKGPHDLSQSLLSQISHFFQHYKDLEANKWVKIEGWTGVETAHEEILTSLKRYEDLPSKPYF